MTFKEVGKGKYNTIINESDGDCFFYSVIDSDVDLIYDNINFRALYKGNRQALSNALRQMAIDRVKEYFRENPAFIPENYANNIDRLYKAMESKDYWADDFMINATCDIFDITPIMINSDRNQIYCGVLQREKYGDNNSLELLQSIESKFILIYYHTDVHFEAIYVKDNYADNYIKNFEGYYGFNLYNEEIMNSIIKKCKFN